VEFIHSYAFQHWAVQFLAVLFLIGGLMTLAVGVGLIGGSAGTLRFLAAMNRWVSTRRALKTFEVPRDTRQAVQKYRRWLAVFFVAGAVFAIFGLATAFNAQAVSFVFGLDTRPSSVASWLVESVRWVLIVGNLAAIVIGIMLGFFPDALAALEARGSHWYSDRQLVRGGDAMNLSLDNWVAVFPRSAGWIIAVAGLSLVSVFGIMLLGIR
jgi:sulfite exporter TauE/SafE